MLDPLWDRVIGIVAREKDGPVGPLITGLHSWVYPGTLSASGGSFEASERAIRGVARRVVEQLAAVLAEHPGMLRRLSSYGAVLDLDVAVPPNSKSSFLSARVLMSPISTTGGAAPTLQSSRWPRT